MLPLDSSHSSDLQTPLTFHFMTKETGDMTAQSLLFPILKAKILVEILEWQLIFFWVGNLGCFLQVVRKIAFTNW